ncbi:class I SAM-dependent methyltransferase [Daejeonella sp. JGW-45]|uniref:class I SAM-dependent methyltransferase n=1 Tax=Daejeonella sp. JGW-45 TaxID=3034148 RepID=UPI0023EDFC95|nr:class I SAM-dependent methyltransferase [Daejeonella sp. JGW-45]
MTESSELSSTDVRGDRFSFGANWANYLKSIDDEKINNAATSMKRMLGNDSLSGLRFLDIGSGSGIHSLVARRLGATVYSLDYDTQSVECTKYLKEKFYPNDETWTVVQGSALDDEFIRSLGEFDIVYSWGVLHHTGNMFKALANADIPVKKNGVLFISIYNDQGPWSKYWTFVKRTYNKNRFNRFLWTYFYIALFTTKGAVKDLFLFKNPFRRYSEYKRKRGMTIHYDLIDWIGGFPFEVAKPEVILDFYSEKGYTLKKLKTCGGGFGCNEFVFVRT